jgi:branched-subunit amino acid ABC-type transport system permease component
MRATASNPALARVSGIRTDRIVDIAWMLSGALCGVAGVVLVVNTATFAASTGSSFLVIIIAAAVLGGVGHPYGAMLGALTIGLATELSATMISPAYKDVAAFVILAIVLLVRPQGIMAALRTEATGGI